MTVLGGLLASSRPRHLRDLASQYSLSPAGVSDILKRLNSVGILKSVRQKNRKCYSLDLIEQERDCLKTFFSIYQKVRLE